MDLETILEYSESDESFKASVGGIATIKQLYDFISGNYEYDRPEDYNEELTTLLESAEFKLFVGHAQKILESFDSEKLKEIQQKSFDHFQDDLNSKLAKTKATLTEGIAPETIERTNVLYYKIEKQTKNQDEYLIVVHSEDTEHAKHYYDDPRAKTCFSIQDQRHFSYFNKGKGGILFGYHSIGNNGILSVTTQDGQTNQREITTDGTMVKKSELSSVEDFMKNTDENTYNEITTNSGDSEHPKLKPDFIIASQDPPTKDEIEVAQIHNIPIYFINEERYIDKKEERKEKTLKDYDPGMARVIEKRPRIIMQNIRRNLAIYMSDVEGYNQISNRITSQMRAMKEKYIS